MLGCRAGGRRGALPCRQSGPRFPRRTGARSRRSWLRRGRCRSGSRPPSGRRRPL